VSGTLIIPRSKSERPRLCAGGCVVQKHQVRAEFPRQRKRGSLTAIKLDGDSLEDSFLGIAYFEPTRGWMQERADADWCRRGWQLLENGGWNPYPAQYFRQEILLTKNNRIAQRAAVSDDDHEA
jgi:hypothetical protein